MGPSPSSARRGASDQYDHPGRYPAEQSEWGGRSLLPWARVLNRCLPSGRSETTVCRSVPCSASAPLSSSRASHMISQLGPALPLQLIGCASFPSPTKPPGRVLPAAGGYPLFAELSAQADSSRFRSVTSNHSNVLHQFLPPPVSYAYNLRPRPHSFILLKTSASAPTISSIECCIKTLTNSC